MQFQFNTGRQYSEHGQRIVVKTASDGIRFHDVDRGIEGFIKCNPVHLESKSEIKEILMFCYDRGIYEDDTYEGALVWEDEA